MTETPFTKVFLIRTLRRLYNVNLLTAKIVVEYSLSYFKIEWVFLSEEDYLKVLELANLLVSRILNEILTISSSGRIMWTPKEIVVSLVNDHDLGITYLIS